MFREMKREKKQRISNGIPGTLKSVCLYVYKYYCSRPYVLKLQLACQKDKWQGLVRVLSSVGRGHRQMRVIGQKLTGIKLFSERKSG